MKKIIFYSLTYLLLCGVGDIFAAQDEEKEPTLITSDGPLDADFANNSALFKDNVVLIDPKGKLQADKMKVFFTEKTNEIKRIECYGNVKIDQEDRYSESDEAIYYALEKKIVLKGDPVIKQNNDHYRAEIITIFTDQKRVVFEPSAQLLLFPDEETKTGLGYASEE